MIRVMFPLILDASSAHVADMASSSLEKFLGQVDSEEFMERLYRYTFSVCKDLVIYYSELQYGLQGSVLMNCLKFMLNHIEKIAEKKAFAFVFSNDMGKFIWLNMKKQIFLDEWNFDSVNCNISSTIFLPADY